MLKSFRKKIKKILRRKIMEISSENNLRNENVWNNILESMEKRLNRHIFDAWFKPIQFESFDENEKVLRLRASQVTKDWVNTNYSEVISQTLKRTQSGKLST